MTTEKVDRRKKTLNRIHRIQGQLAALEKDIAADRTCEHLVTQALAIEKGMGSLVQHMISGYLQHQAKDLMEENPDEAIKEIQRLFELSKR